MKKSIMFGFCFLSIINAQEKGPASSIIFANLHSEINDQMASQSPEQLFSADNIEDLREQSDRLGKAIAARLERLIDQVGRDQSTSPSDSDDQPNSSQDSPSAEQDILGEAFQGFATLNRQQQQALEEILRITGQNTRATQLLGQVVTAQNESLIDANKRLELTVKKLEAIRAELAALRLARESDRQAQRKKDDANSLATYKWYLEIKNQSGRNEALALTGGVFLGAWFAYQMMLDNLNGGSSGHH